MQVTLCQRYKDVRNNLEIVTTYFIIVMNNLKRYSVAKNQKKENNSTEIHKNVPMNNHLRDPSLWQRSIGDHNFTESQIRTGRSFHARTTPKENDLVKLPRLYLNEMNLIDLAQHPIIRFNYNLVEFLWFLHLLSPRRSR